jgi:hypothetical protein
MIVTIKGLLQHKTPLRERTLGVLEANPALTSENTGQKEFSWKKVAGGSLHRESNRS